MNQAAERLESLRVADCMQKDVVSVRADQTMAKVAEALLAHPISGAPVVAATGRCVGMLSAHDFIRREQSWRGDGSPSEPRGPRHALVQQRPGPLLRLEKPATTC